MQKGTRLALLEFDMGWFIWLTKEHMPFHIGRQPNNDLCNSSNFISRHHCIIDYKDDTLMIIDNNSINGTILHDKVIRSKSEPIYKRTCLLISDTMLWITPSAHALQSSKNHVNTIEDFGQETLSDNYHGEHGVCIVDVCNSVELGLDKVNIVTQSLKSLMVLNNQDNVLAIKYTGDGYMAIYKSPEAGLVAIKNLLKWQKSTHNTENISIRIALDVGLTHPAPGNEQVGLPICRASRMEKIQHQNIDNPAKDVTSLKTKNRCLLTGEAKEQLNLECTFIGSSKLRGFGDQLTKIYQYCYS